MRGVIEAVEAIKKQLGTAEELSLSSFDEKNTMLIVIDMNNGFAKSGALYSNRVEKMITDIATLCKIGLQRGMKVYAYTDHHPEDAKEFMSYPLHCIGTSVESQLVDELLVLKEQGLKTIFKNSTNGVLAYNPIEKDQEIHNFIIVGCVTDICVYQYAITLRAYLNEHQLEGDVFISMNHVETFDIEGVHHGDLMQAVFLKSLMDNGVKMIKNMKIS